MTKIKFKITENDAGRTLYKFIARSLTNLPISAIEKLFRKKDIKLNGKKHYDKKTILVIDDIIEIYTVEDGIKKQEANTAVIDFFKIYEDENILIVNKKRGYSMSDEENSLDNQVLKYLKFKKTDSFIPSSIGRLDKVTSGLVVYAKNYLTLVQLKSQQNHFTKIYIFKNDMPYIEQNIKLYLIKDEAKKKVKASYEDNGGKLAETKIFFEKNKKYAQILTGRKHQIRVSLAKIGYPILGDIKYGGKKADHVFLHSERITFKKLSNKLEYLNNKEFISPAKW